MFHKQIPDDQCPMIIINDAAYHHEYFLFGGKCFKPSRRNARFIRPVVSYVHTLAVVVWHVMANARFDGASGIPAIENLNVRRIIICSAQARSSLI